VVYEELPRNPPVYDELPPARGDRLHLVDPPSATSEATEQLERGRLAMAEAEAARARDAQRARETEMVRREMARAEETARRAREAEAAARAAEAHHQRLAEEAAARRAVEAAAVEAAARRSAAESAARSSPSAPVDPASTSSNPYAAFTRTPDGREVRQVLISPDLPEEFRRIAAANTARSVETCGVLAGRLHRGSFTVTTLIIPSQTGTADTCNTLDEDRLFTYQDANDVITLGWIHTHPTQDCFLSSVDLHTQFAYQVMMDEAIAIVVAPTAAETLGVFSLSAHGLRVLRDCPRSGFHPHPEGGLYGEASHIVWSRVPFNVADLRR
jgi:STAM-binding protein